MDAFQHSFGLDKHSKDFSNLQGNIVSVLQAGCFFGALSSFYISDTFGRKRALIIADIIFIIGSLVQTLIFGGNLAQLYVGRVIGGFGVGLISAVVPTYIGECAPKQIRGRCIGCMQLFNVTGICLAFFVNFGINLDIKSATNEAKWRIPFALQILPGALLLAGIVFMAESPRWLVEKNRQQDAARALSFVRNRPVDDPLVVQELDEIIQDFNGHEKMSLVAQIKAAGSSKQMFYRTSFGVILMFWQQWTGTNSINYYAPQIFSKIGLTGTSSGLFATGVYGIVKIVVTAIGLMAFTEQLGRKWSLLIGSAGQAFAMFYIGSMFSPRLLLLFPSKTPHPHIKTYILTPTSKQRSPPPQRRPRRQRHLRHNLRLPLRRLLLLRLGPHALHPLLRMLAQPRALASNGRLAHDAMALQLRHRQAHAHHVGGHHVRNLFAVRQLVHCHGRVDYFLCPRDEGRAVGEDWRVV